MKMRNNIIGIMKSKSKPEFAKTTPLKPPMVNKLKIQLQKVMEFLNEEGTK